MNKIKYIITLLYIVASVSCISMMVEKNDITEFSSDAGYVGIYLTSGYNFAISFQNLDTDEVIVVNLRNDKKLIVVELPIGEYAISKFSFLGNNPVGIPFLLTSPLYIEANTLTFLGGIVKHDTFMKKKLEYIYPWDELLTDISENYYYDDNFSVTPLEPLSLENNTDSNFDFSL